MSVETFEVLSNAFPSVILVQKSKEGLTHKTIV